MAGKKESDNDQYKKVKQRFGGAPRSGKGGGNGPKKPFNFYWIYAVVLVVLISVNLFNMSSGLVSTTYGEFIEMAEAGDVKKVVIFNEKIAEVTLTTDAIQSEKYKKRIKPPLIGGVNTGPHFTFNLPAGKEQFSEQLERFRQESSLTVDYQTRENWGQELIQWLLFLAIIVAFWVIIMRRVSGGGGPGGQIFNFGKSKAQVFEKGKSTNVTFADVAGLEEGKEEIQEIVEFLKNPKKYTNLGAKIPKGALLVGPPGTGKTLLAKAVAGEAKVPFFSLSGSDFVEMFVGVGASRVRDLFKQAKEKAPCIIFIDEIDAIGRARGKNVNVGSNDERENTLNQLLTEMDGFGTNSGVILLAATNRADVLDRALLRAGRFDRQIYVDMPDLNERKAIFNVHIRPLKIAEDLDVNFLAKQTPGFSGADIANVCNEAALIAARRNKKKVDKQDFLDAVDRIVGGLEKKNKIITPQEKKTIAYHEAGHATVSWLLEHASPLVKVTIVPRGQSLGAAWYLPEERQITTRAQILDEMAAALGGRAAEDIIFGEISTGALSDLEKVTKQAYAMVKIYGLNDKIGNISFYDRQQEYQFQKPYSEEMAKTMDSEVHILVEREYERAKELLSNNKDKLELLAKKLLEKEVIFKEDLEEIFGKRPWKSGQDELLENKATTVDSEGENVKDQPKKEKEADSEATTDNGSSENPEDVAEEPTSQKE